MISQQGVGGCMPARFIAGAHPLVAPHLTPHSYCVTLQAFELTLDIDRLIKEVDYDRCATATMVQCSC